jgi:hypothetical protein
MPPRPPALPDDDDAPPGLAWDAGDTDTGWDEPLLDTGDEDEGPLAWLSPLAATRRRTAPPDDDRPTSRWGALGAALADATDALARLDARWADLPAPL